MPEPGTRVRKGVVKKLGAASPGQERGFDMEIVVESLVVAGLLGWLARGYTRHLNYRECCRLRLR